MMAILKPTMKAIGSNPTSYGIGGQHVLVNITGPLRIAFPPKNTEGTPCEPSKQANP